MSQTDALTGLDNRRHLERAASRRCSSTRSGSTSRSRCVMCDLDKFKSVNDTYGHQAGDEVLKQLADILKDEAREIDRVGRYGGEEFMLLLPGTVLDAAVTFAERVRKRIEAHTFTFPGGTLHAHGQLRRRRGGRTRGSTTCDALVRTADDALYVAKETGRNRVVRFDGDEFNAHHRREGWSRRTHSAATRLRRRQSPEPPPSDDELARPRARASPSSSASATTSSRSSTSCRKSRPRSTSSTSCRRSPASSARPSASIAARSSSRATRTRSASSRATRIRRSATSSSTSIATRSSSARSRAARRCSSPTPRTTRCCAASRRSSTCATCARSSSCRSAGRAR